MADECETIPEPDEEFLFGAFDSDQELNKKSYDLKDAPCKKPVGVLESENMILKRALRKLLSCPSTNDGSQPCAEVLYFDNTESKKYRTHIENFFKDLYTGSQGNETPGVSRPQPSAVTAKLDARKSGAESTKVIAVGCVKFFDIFCVDNTGAPVPDISANLIEEWDIPAYQQQYMSALPPDEDQKKGVRLKQLKACFNCGSPKHDLRDCKERRDLAKINKNRLLHESTRSPRVKCVGRYHENTEPDQRYSKFQPGQVSQSLRKALGISDSELPPYIYAMRRLGYPPGYLVKGKEKENIVMYDALGNEVKEEEMEDGEIVTESEVKFIEYPGFNVPTPEGVRDAASELGFLPIQPHHLLANIDQFKERLPNPKKHGREEDTPDRPQKRMKTDRYEVDMEVENEVEAYDPSVPWIDTPWPETSYIPAQDRTTPKTADDETMEDGEVVSDDDNERYSADNEQGTNSSNGDNNDQEDIPSPGQEDIEPVESDDVTGYRKWWVTKPLIQTTKTKQDTSPPPIPNPVVPLAKLTRFMPLSFEDRAMWLDPIFGNVQENTGRYDRLKVILKKFTKVGKKR